MNAYYTMFHTHPSSADALNSPGSLSSAALSLSPCGRSPAPSQRCFALLGLAPDISESSAQTAQPALSARPDSLPCSDTELLGLKTSHQCLSANSSSKTTLMLLNLKSIPIVVLPKKALVLISNNCKNKGENAEQEVQMNPH